MPAITRSARPDRNAAAGLTGRHVPVSRRLRRADTAGQGVSPVLRAVQAHQPVVRVGDHAVAAPDLVGSEREHQAPRRGVTLQRRDCDLAGGGQDRLGEVIDGVDVPPELGRGICGGLDHVQMDAVGEDKPAAGPRPSRSLFARRQACWRRRQNLIRAEVPHR